MRALLHALARTATGMAVGGIVTHQLFHLREAVAFTLKATTMAERLGSVFVAAILFVLLAYMAFQFFSRSFFHGFIVAAGLILSLDIVLLHWIFQLHRITSGPEADVLEPLFVMCGIALTIIGVRRELATRRRDA
jgi:uncharacterized membrane protein